MTPHQPSIYRLSQDIFILILELIRKLAPETLRQIRRVSRAWNQAILPVVYRSVDITAKLFSDPNGSVVQQILTYIRHHSRHICIKEELDWKAGIDFISECKSITRIEYIIQATFCSLRLFLTVRSWEWWGDRHGWLSRDTFGTFTAIKSLWPRADLRLLNYPWPSRDYSDNHTPTIPIENIVFISTCIVMNCFRNYEPLSKVVEQSPKLKVLQLKSMNLTVWKNIKVPPIRELVLDGCSWKLNSSEVDLMWNFSNLESLQISPIVPADKFFGSLSRDDLRRLRRLHITAAFHPHYPLLKESLTQHLDHFIANGEQLEEIELSCHVPLLRMTSISKHSRLMILKIHDYTGFHYDWEICPSFSLEDMAVLARSCPRLQELSLDLDSKASEIKGFVEILASLRNLRILKLRMRSVLSETGDNSSTTDADFEAASELKTFLCLNKAGLPMLSLIVYTGGYGGFPRPNRDGDAWKLQRRQGHNPERCFEFSWLPDGSEAVKSFATTYSELRRA